MRVSHAGAVCALFILPLLAAACSAQSGDKSPIVRADGTSIAWSLVMPRTSPPKGLLYVAQGSGCAPAAGNGMLLEAWAVAPDHALLRIEKPGVEPTDRPEDPLEQCSQAFLRDNTVSARVADAATVIAELRTQYEWADNLALFGGSEGGAVVARLTPIVRPKASVIYSTGLGETLLASLQRVVPPEALGQLDTMIARAAEDGDSTEMWGGNTLKWWADIGDTLLVNDILTSTVPVLLLQGEMDRSAPVESARLAAAAFTSAGNCALTYREYGGLDHFMVDADGQSHRRAIFAEAAGWLEDAQTSGPACLEDARLG